MKMRHHFAGYVVLGVLGGLLSAGAQESHIGSFTGHARDASDGFKRFCAGCHSARGDGRGTFAPYLDPRPRDFTAAIYKCRSTPSGSLPTDQDLFDTLNRGIVTTAMPSWAPLTEQSRADLVAYIKNFSPRSSTETIPPAIVVPAELPVTEQGIQHGAQLYARLDCAKCHGVRGQGDGPAADTLMDIKHQPLPPYDFTVSPRFKCGNTNAGLYRVLWTGMDGTPMMSYADKLTPDETWDLIHFVRTLQTDRKGPENSVEKKAKRGKPNP